MGRSSTIRNESDWKRRWELTFYGLLGLQVTGICWSDEIPAARPGQAPALIAGAIDTEEAGGIQQVGHKKCSDPNCDQCRPRWRRKVCPPEWYMESPLWQSITGNENGAGNMAGAGAGAAGDQNMAGANLGTTGDAGLGAANPGFMDLASANPSNLAPNIIGDLFGSGNLNVTGVSAAEGNAILSPNENYGNGPITTLHQIVGTNPLNTTDVIFAPLRIPGDVNSGPGDVLAAQNNKTFGSTTDQVLYRFTVSGLNATIDRDSHGNLITAPISASPNSGNPGLFAVNQYNTQAGAVNRVGQLRIAENVSPMPRDRIFFNYSYFQDAQFSQVLQSDVNRFTPGFEKTFMDGNGSIEFRAPFATSLDSVVNLSDGQTNSGNVAWGNLNLTAKILMYRSSSFAFSTGLQVVVPTARDTILKSDVTGDVVDGRISNGATHLLPFAGWLYTPNDRFFGQGFLQVDTDANGNGIYANNYLIDPSMAPMGAPKRIGTLYDTTNLYTSTSAGYWVYRSDSPDTLVQGWAPVMELHTSNSLEKADFVQRGQFQAGSPNRHVETINMVLGVHTQLRDRRFISAAYAFPVSGQADRQFQGEFRLLLNQLFGPINRQTAAGFFGG